jgi:hypothetical protein
MQNITAQNITSSSAQPYRPRVCENPGYRMNPKILAYLDFGLFQSLCNLGTSRECICSALNVSYRDFDYLLELTAAQRQV